MTFEEDLRRIERSLPVPYPDRALLLEELGADLEAVYRELRAQGLGEADARAAALQRLELDRDALARLGEVHAPAISRALNRLPPPARSWLDASATALPLAGLCVLLFTEVPLVLFLREGGFPIYLVLATGGLGLFLEMQRFFTWFVLRDHSVPALRKNTSTPLYLAGATLGLGILGTAVDYYVVFWKWSERAISEEAYRVGLREPLPCLIVGAALATLIVLVHGALLVGLRAIRVPDADRGAG